MISVLYVDDEPGLLEIGKVFLEQSGQFQVETTISATDALTTMQSKVYDAIISDFQMPGMDGIELLKTVRSSGDTIPFILFTGKGREEVVIQAINNGADFYLQKGGDPTSQFAELQHKVRTAVQQRRAQDALIKSEAKYRQLIENANEIIVVVQDGILKLINRNAVNITGYSEQELLSMPFPELIYPDDRDLVIERHRKRMTGE